MKNKFSTIFRPGLFSNFDSLEVLGRSGVYRHTFGMKIHRPHGLVVECWAINREVSGSILLSAELRDLATQ